MGFYLNNKSKVSLYKSEMQRPYFVDKTLILSELFPFIESGNSHICITRPRRFGKTVMANMIGAFFEKDEDTKEILTGILETTQRLNTYNCTKALLEQLEAC